MGTDGRLIKLIVHPADIQDRDGGAALLKASRRSFPLDLFPAWFLAQGCDRRVIATSNTGDLAGTFSRRVRGRIRTHGPTLGYRLEREAEDFWTTTTGGEYRAAGIGGVITGLRADLALIDDPVKSREEADSDARRNRIWEWFQDDLRTRLRPRRRHRGGADPLARGRPLGAVLSALVPSRLVMGRRCGYRAALTAGQS